MQIEHNRFQKNPNWLKTVPVGYLQAWPRIWTQDDREQIQQVARAGRESNPGPLDCESVTPTTRPRCPQKNSSSLVYVLHKMCN